MTIGVAWADKYDGVYQRLDTPIFSPEIANIEDPCIWMNADGYHLIAKDMEGNLCGEFHGGMYAHSDDGLDWQIAQGTLAYSRDILWDDGQTRRMGSLERPSVLVEDGRPRQLNFATADGPGTFTKAQNTWNIAIPLR